MHPRVSASQLMQYLHVTATSPASVGGKARDLRTAYGAPYQPARDWWRGMRGALGRDRRTTRDGQALRAAATNVRDPKKKPLYSATATAWPAVAQRWNDHEHFPISPVTLTIGGLDVRVSPSFAEEGPAGIEVVLGSFTELKIRDEAIDAVLRLMQRAYPGTTAVYVDMRRPEHIRTTHGRNLECLDDWIESAGIYLAHVLADVA